MCRARRDHVVITTARTVWWSGGGADFQRYLLRPAGNGQVVARLVLVTKQVRKDSGSSRRFFLWAMHPGAP